MNMSIAPPAPERRRGSVQALLESKPHLASHRGTRSTDFQEMGRRSSHRQLVPDVPLLRDLQEAQLDRLLADASVRQFAKDETFFCEGEQASTLHLMLSGLVELFTTESGRDRIVLIMSRPDIFMPGAALGREPYLLSARALRPARTLLLDAAAVRREMQACPRLASRMSTIIAGQFRTVVRHLKDLKTRTGPQRLAAFLLCLIDESAVPGSAELPFPKRILASRMGMSAESLSRSIQLLADHGLLIRAGRAVLLDREAVERFCHPDPLIDGRELRLHVSAL